MPKSLFTTLLALLLLASVLPVGVVGLVSVSEGVSRLSRGAHELAYERTVRLAGEASWLLKEPGRLADVELGDAHFSRLTEDDQRAVIAHLLERRSEIAAVGLLDARPQRLADRFVSRSGTPAEAFADHAGLAMALGKSGRMSLVGSPRLVGEAWLAPLAIVLAQGSEARFAVLEIALPGLDKLLREGAGAHVRVLVVDRAGRLVAAPPLAGARGGVDLSSRPSVAMALGTPAARSAEVPAADGPVVAAWTPIPGTEWMLVTEEPSENALAGVVSLQRALVVAVALALLAAVGLSAYFARRILRPLRVLSQKALELAQGQFGVQAEVPGMGEIARLAEVFNYMSQQMLAYDGETRRLYQGLEEGYLQTMLALASVIDSKDSYTLGHSQRVGEWAAAIGGEMNLPDLQVRHLLYGGILHDVGKIGVVEPILCKRSRLTEEEMDAMKGHPVIGASIIAGVGFLKPVVPAVRHHHERWDGSGYPDRLKGEEIPLIARIVGVADVWDACTSIRPYQKAMPAEQALEVMLKFQGTQLDPKVVEALERVVRKKQAKGELVSAGDGGAGTLPSSSASSP